MGAIGKPTGTSSQGVADGGVEKRPGRSRRRRRISGTVDSGGSRASEEEEALVFSEPVFVPPATFDPVLGLNTFRSVDYDGSRYSVGDHVALYAGPGKEWVCIIEQLYMSPDTGKPSFKGRWYWTLGDVEEHRAGRGEKARSSKNAKYELICSDNRDSNLIEVINRKCTILSWKNFKDLFKRNRNGCDGLYFCDRMYYHMAFKFQELTPLTFPGDPLPAELMPAPNTAPISDPITEQIFDADALRSERDDECSVADQCRDPEISPANPSNPLRKQTKTEEKTNQKQDSSAQVLTYYLF